jgi:hypothetical protein
VRTLAVGSNGGFIRQAGLNSSVPVGLRAYSEVIQSTFFFFLILCE